MFVFLKSPIVVMILILCVSTNFFKNLANIYRSDIDQRINNVYGFCSNSSIGYLNYLKKLYQLNQNPEIINYKQSGPVKWAITNTKDYIKNNNQFILLNYPGEIINLELRENNKNEYELRNYKFFKYLIQNNFNIEILNYSNNKKHQTFELELSTKDQNKVNQVIKKINIRFEENTKKKILVNFQINEHLIYDKIYLKFNNLEIDKTNNLKISSINKFLLKDYNIINNEDNCYLVESR
jgi:hypothetical protein